ncbi:YlbF family regulator [Lacticaseibacillus jixiensis]|uniref:YlbF family regulator n=1 Tax=Lacticaseibacillus jixiensis TaxID=3231926 RepID=UPI0036F2ED81
MANVYDTANQLAQDLQQSQQFLDMKKSFEMLKLDAVAYALFQQFQDKQMTLQKKQMNGQEISDDEINDLQTLGGKMQSMDPINDLMAKEQALSQVMDDINRTISQPIADLYQAK